MILRCGTGKTGGGFKQPIHVHELQNHYYQMTKVELGRN